MADKTYVPGVDDSYSSSAPERTDYPESREQRASSIGRATLGNATFIPDAEPDPRDSGVRNSSLNGKNKPLLGFLYSVSRTSFGEYWPVYLGPNTIGRSEKSDIVLSEGTVSSEHATLIVHQEDDGEVYAGIKDNGSTHGVKVNGKSAHFDVAGCKHMDIIKIGKNYELLFILLDAESLGLKRADGFVEVARTATKRVDKRIITGDGTNVNPYSGLSNPSSRLKNPSASERTHAMDGGTESRGGGTTTR